MLKPCLVAVTLLSLAACNKPDASPITLYRNSQIDHAMRIHFATFDAAEKTSFNLSNCQMAARLLNANVDALAKRDGGTRDKSLGFWCEVGAFDESGLVPIAFDNEFPTEAR